jgi:transposase
MFVRGAADVIPRARQAVGAKTMTTAFFTAKKLMVFNILPRDSRFNQLDFINSIFSDLLTEILNFRRQKTESTFWVHVELSMCIINQRLRQKIKKNHISRMPHPPYSPNIIPYDFWLFGMLKQILRDRKFSSSDEIEDAIAQAWNGLTFDDIHSVFRD